MKKERPSSHFNHFFSFRPTGEICTASNEASQTTNVFLPSIAIDYSLHISLCVRNEKTVIKKRKGHFSFRFFFHFDQREKSALPRKVHHQQRMYLLLGLSSAVHCIFLSMFEMTFVVTNLLTSTKVISTAKRDLIHHFQQP